MSNFGELRNYYGMPKGKAPVPDDAARHLIHGYYACVSYIDALIGQIIEELVQLKLDKNTIIVLWGDHGWKLGEHGSWSKHTNFEIDVNAPLIISIPGMRNIGQETKALVEFVDIYPTLCDLTGLPKPTHLEGTSFTPLLEDPNRPWKMAAFSLWVHQKYRYNKETQIIGYTMRTDHYRYTEWIHTKSSEVKARELYDHQRDPGENFNVIKDPIYSEDLKKLEAMMKSGWKAAKPDG
jgi:arylsulfatase A-like enzyme